MEKPMISIIICTYNGQDYIENCIQSILSQSLKDLEILCLDGGSSDKTIEIIKYYLKKDRRIKFFINPKRLPEGKGYGKWLGFRKASGKIVGIIDQDNIIQDSDLLKKVSKELENEKNIVGVLGGLSHDKNEKKIIRYISLFGTDSFLAYRSVDFLHSLNKINYYTKNKNPVMIINTNDMQITGGNCFFYRKKDVEEVGGYERDILVVSRLVKNGKNKVVIIPNATKHYAEKNLFYLVIKKFKWGKVYFTTTVDRFDYFPKTTKERKSFLLNAFSSFLLFPNFYYSLKIYLRKNDPITFIYPFISILNGFIYGFNFVRSKI